MNKKLFSVLLLGFVNGLGFSLFLPMLPFIIEDFGQGAVFFGLLASVYSFGQFFAAPVFGTISDKIGRRILLIWSHVGTLISLLLFMGALFLPVKEVWGVTLPLRGILFARLLDGITGGNNSIAQAYIADITKPKERSKVFGMFAATIGLAIMVGPAIGGRASGLPQGYAITVLIAILISVLTLFFLIFFLEETVDVSHTDKKLNRSEFHFFKNFGLLKQVPKLQKRFVAYGIFTMAFIGFVSINLLYAKDILGFTQTQIGTMYFIIGIILIFHQIVSLRILAKKISDKKLFFIGTIIIGLALLVYWTKPGVYLFFGNIFFLALGLSITMPSFKGIITNLVSDKDKGKIMGLDESLNSANQAVIPIISTSLYAGISYWIFGWYGVLLLLAIGFLIINSHYRKRNS